MIARARALAALILASSTAAFGQAYPSHPIKMIVPWPPGQATDVAARMVSEKLSPTLGQPVVVDNRPGAGGVVGCEVAAKSPADGYTLVAGSSGPISISPNVQKVAYNPLRDFTGISLIAVNPFVLVVNPSIPANNVKELIALLKANPGKYSFASSGAGTTPHITGEMFKAMAGVNLLHVPYKGSAPAYQDLLANQVDMMWDNIPGPLNLMRGGKVRGVAVTSKERHPAAKDIPTMAETIPGFEITSWGGICGPAGVPPAVVEKLSALASKALDTPAVKEAFDKQGATAFWMSPTDTAAYRVADEKRLAPVIKASGAKVE